MSNLQELIQKLCPSGVEYRKLGDLCCISIGEFVHKNKQTLQGKYPVYNGGKENTGFYDEYNNTGNKVIISARGANAGFVNKIFTNYWAGNSCYSLSPSDEMNLNWIFLYYILKSKEKEFINSQQTGSIPALSKKQIEQIEIPVPPLAVQEEIVRILDCFTEFTVELQAELQARKEQYEYYQNKLLRFPKDIVCKLKIGDIYHFQYGTGNKIPNEPGKYPVYGSNGIVGSYVEYNSEDAPVIGHIGAYAGIVNWASGKHFVTYNGVICKLINKRVLPKYGYYILLQQDYLSKAKTGSQPFISYDVLEKPIAKIPSLSEQERIVEILDKFETLVNDLSQGIPAEIAAVQEQYEYYRKKLLSFQKIIEV